jgi:hypothetical protein
MAEKRGDAFGAGCNQRRGYRRRRAQGRSHCQRAGKVHMRLFHAAADDGGLRRFKRRSAFRRLG